MIICSNCSKENQDHYKFCLGCGARLAGASAAQGAPGAATPVRTGGTVVADAARPAVSVPRGGTVVASETNTGPTPVRPSAPQIPPLVGVDPTRAAPMVGAPILAAPTPPSAAPTQPSSACSSCGMVNPVGFLFCGRCGNRLIPAASAPVVAAPVPVVASAPAAAPIPVVKKPGLRASMHLLREDGSEGGTLHLEDGPIPFGRDYGAPFDADLYLNPRHCAFTVAVDGVRVDDLTATNGVYRKIEGSIELQHGDTFRVGQELLYYEDLPEPEVLPDGTERMGSPNPGYWGRVSVLVEIGRACEAMPVVGAEFTVGRERGDLTFPTDGYVSSSHCRIVGDDSGVYLEDRGSSNGTYLRVRSGTVVPFGSLVLIGQQLFHVRQA
ncbi:FHA domain-containing protein [Nannocystis sp.]|uniref:FHA domain-containing protein n=1 Tax=Nannocystis sp. TaxID=1962667 RepID=UPI0025EE8D52|nr:FHA domain-containing protein [Nannocystis sp.]MBK7824039.1 FHA domain-containing protein [Nannocystis sp.]